MIWIDAYPKSILGAQVFYSHIYIFSLKLEWNTYENGKLFFGGGKRDRAKISRKICLGFGQYLTFFHLLLPTSITCLRNKKNYHHDSKFLYKTISTYWYTATQGIQIYCKWLD